MLFIRILINDCNSPIYPAREGNHRKVIESRINNRFRLGGDKTMVACQTSHESVLQLMVQTPYTLFAYWDLTNEYLDLARSSLSGVTPELSLRLVRMNHTSTEAVANHTMPDSALRGNYYFTQQRPHSAYFAELGFSSHTGFFTLLRSNQINTPPDGKPTHHVESGSAYDGAHSTFPEEVPAALPFVYSPEEETKRGE
jgi:hypothetical protein